MITDTVTILRGVGPFTDAAKVFTASENGEIKVTPYSGCRKFNVNSVSLSGLDDLGNLIKAQQEKQDEFLIRGEQVVDGNIVMRRLAGNEHGVFDDIARRWLMIDVDGFPLPEWINPARDPDAAAKWTRAALPRPFRKTRAFYQFSSSQNVPRKLGEKPPSVAKIHFFFSLNRPILAVEWRKYFRAYPVVDSNIYTAVHPYYIAKPVFKGMDDPMPKRCGFISGETDIVTVPEFHKEKT